MGCWHRYIYLGSLRTCGGAGTDIYTFRIFKDLWGTGTDIYLGSLRTCGGNGTDIYI